METENAKLIKNIKKIKCKITKKAPLTFKFLGLSYITSKDCEDILIYSWNLMFYDIHPFRCLFSVQRVNKAVFDLESFFLRTVIQYDEKKLQDKLTKSITKK